jgi:hypothetical protein
MTDVFLCMVYVVLVAAVTLPDEEGETRLMFEFREAEAIFCALLSVCFLPWSGASFLAFTGLGSQWWFAAMGGAIALSRGNFKTVCLACLAAVAAALGWFMEAVGIPGKLYDLESLSMIWRLCGLRDLRLLAAGIFFFVGLALSLAGVFVNTAGCGSFASRFFSSLAAFSFSGFLLTVFFPVDTALLGPPFSAAALPAVLFLLSIPLSRLLLKLTLPRKAHFLVPPVLVLAGCLFLWRVALTGLFFR